MNTLSNVNIHKEFIIVWYKDCLCGNLIWEKPPLTYHSLLLFQSEIY